MRHRPPKKSTPIEILSACCPEAQADGVPCTELGRDCESCQRATKSAAKAEPVRDIEERDDSWAV